MPDDEQMNAVASIWRMQPFVVNTGARAGFLYGITGRWTEVYMARWKVLNEGGVVLVPSFTDA
ncbi:MAG: hypothetical protein ACLUI7_06480 [Coprococcus sp.]